MLLLDVVPRGTVSKVFIVKSSKLVSVVAIWSFGNLTSV